MDAKLLESFVLGKGPLEIETASGKIYKLPHSDFLEFSAKRTAIYLHYVENQEERIALVPLLTVTAASMLNTSVKGIA